MNEGSPRLDAESPHLSGYGYPRGLSQCGEEGWDKDWKEVPEFLVKVPLLHLESARRLCGLDFRKFRRHERIQSNNHVEEARILERQSQLHKSPRNLVRCAAEEEHSESGRRVEEPERH